VAKKKKERKRKRKTKSSQIKNKRKKNKNYQKKRKKMRTVSKRGAQKGGAGINVGTEIGSSSMKSIATQQTPLDIATTTTSPSTVFMYQSVVVVLVVILMLVLLGHNTITIFFGWLLHNITNAVSVAAAHVSYAFGTIVNSASNLASNTAISGIQVLDGATNEFGDIFREAGARETSPFFRQQLDATQQMTETGALIAPPPLVPPPLVPPPPPSPLALAPSFRADMSALPLGEAINQSMRIEHQPRSDGVQGPIQGPIRVAKMSYCLLDTSKNERGCVQLHAGDMCASGALFPDRTSCERLL
jgi:hypothetical protein